MYQLNGNGAIPRAPLISARSLVHRRLSKAQRALVGAAILEGGVQLQDLPLRIVSQVVGCSVAYLTAAQRLAPAQREAVVRGHRPLILPRVVPAPNCASITNLQLKHIIRAAGIDRVLEAAVAVEHTA
jgi:hypothetical protein